MMAGDGDGSGCRIRMVHGGEVLVLLVVKVGAE